MLQEGIQATLECHQQLEEKALYIYIYNVK